MPINYYNQLIGILVDTTILKILIKKLLPKLSIVIENNKDYDGHFIGENFINKTLVNLFISKTIDRNISLLILDYLFLKGNKVIFQAFLSIYEFLNDLIIKGEKCIETFNQIINEELKKLNINNQDFLYNLFFKYEKAISKLNINELRNTFSISIARSLEEKNIEYVKTKVKLAYNSELYEKQINNFLKCHKEWPYCINDSCFENVTRVIDNLAFGKKEINYIDNYFFSKKKKHLIKKKSFENGQKDYNIILERRPHYCSDKQEEMNLKMKDKDKDKDKEKDKEKDLNNNIKNIDNIKIDEENKINENLNINIIKEDEKEEEINDKMNFIKNSITQENLLNISKIIENEISDDIYIPDKDDE